MKPQVQMLRARDLAELLGVSTRRVYQLAKQGRLPVVREGRAMLFPRPAWEAWLHARTQLALRCLRADE